MPVQPTYGEWLQSDALKVTATNPAIAAAWADDAQTSERITALATVAGADAEAARQLAFMQQPMAVEVHRTKGKFVHLIGKVITITGTRLGYQAGLAVKVLAAADDHATGLSEISVLRRL